MENSISKSGVCDFHHYHFLKTTPFEIVSISERSNIVSEQKERATLDSDLQSFLAWFQRIDDRLVLVSLPVVIFSLILWAVGNAFPVIGTIISLTISILLLLVACVLLLRLVEIGWRWSLLAMEDDGTDPTYIFGLFGIAGLLIGGVGCSIDMIMHAGGASDSRKLHFIADS